MSHSRFDSGKRGTHRRTLSHMQHLAVNHPTFNCPTPSTSYCPTPHYPVPHEQQQQRQHIGEVEDGPDIEAHRGANAPINEDDPFVEVDDEVPAPERAPEQAAEPSSPPPPPPNRAACFRISARGPRYCGRGSCSSSTQCAATPPPPIRPGQRRLHGPRMVPHPTIPLSHIPLSSIPLAQYPIANHLIPNHPTANHPTVKDPTVKHPAAPYPTIKHHTVNHPTVDYLTPHSGPSNILLSRRNYSM